MKISRAKAKIRDAGIPYRVPSSPELPDRLRSVLAVVYLVFNEGYAATSGESLAREELTAEAIRLGRLLAALTPDEHALFREAIDPLLQEARQTYGAEMFEMVAAAKEAAADAVAMDAGARL